LTVNVVVAVKAEVPPVAVIDLDPPVWSATTSGESANEQPPVALVRQVDVEKLAVVKAVVDTVTVSAAPKPLTVNVPVLRLCSGNPKLLPVALNETFGVMLNTELTVLVPSDTTMV